MTLDIAKIRGQISPGATFVRIVVAEHKGSTPREAGSAMLVGDGFEHGTIGGGAVELEAMRFARSILGKKEKQELLNLPLGPALGQCCGGAVKLFLELMDAEKLLEIEGLDDFYVRPVSSGSGDPSLKVNRVLREMRNGKIASQIRLVDGWLIEPIGSTSVPLWVYGAGHVGRAIVTVLEGLPFQVTWVDTARERFPDVIPQHADMLVAHSPSLAVKHAPDDAHHIVLTYSHAIDFEICHAVLTRKFAHLGLIGSDTKRSRFIKRLREAGVDPAKMQCPIGDRSLGKEPMAIAVGVVAELIKIHTGQKQQLEASA